LLGDEQAEIDGLLGEYKIKGNVTPIKAVKDEPYDIEKED